MTYMYLPIPEHMYQGFYNQHLITLPVSGRQTDSRMCCHGCPPPFLLTPLVRTGLGVHYLGIPAGQTTKTNRDASQ
jgi:hypothetical protein